MAEPNVDNPGEITWFKSHGPATVLGLCPHSTCDHHSTSVVAWGPDMQRYTLDRCDVAGGCDKNCRAWHTERPYVPTSDWLQVADTARRAGR